MSFHRYPIENRLRSAFRASVVSLILVGGVGYLVNSPPASLKFWILICSFMGVLGWSAFRSVKHFLRLGDSIEVDETGIVYRAWGRDTLVVPWSQVTQVRALDGLGGVAIDCALSFRPIEADHDLLQIELLHAALTAHVGPRQADSAGSNSESRVA